MRRSLRRWLNAAHGVFLTLGYLFAGVVSAVIVVIAAFQLEFWSLALAAIVPLAISVVFIILKASPKFESPYSDAAGNARMGKTKDLRKADLLGVDRQGIYCGMSKGRSVFYRGEGHIVTFGPPRSGKGTALAIPQIWHSDRSLVILDPKAELAAVTYNYRRRKGPALVFNPLGVLTDSHPHLKSCGFNPYRVPSFAKNLFSSCGSLAKYKIPMRGHKEIFFPESARELSQSFHMMANIKDPETASLRDFNEMLRLPYSSEEEKARTIQKLMKAWVPYLESGGVKGELASLCNGFTEAGSGTTMFSIIKSATTPMANLSNSRLLADLDKHPVIDGEPFDFEMLKHRTMTVYIVLPDDKLTEYNFWLRMIVGSALDALRSTGPGKINPLIMIDEAGNLGALDALKEATSMAAGKGITIWTFWQYLEQITEQYGKLGSILGGASVINAFPGVDFETAKYLSEMMGNKTEVTATYNQKPDLKDSSKSEGARGYPLQRAENIRIVEKGRLLSIIQGRPFELEAPGYFDMGMSGLDPNPYRRKTASPLRKLSYGRA